MIKKLYSALYRDSGYPFSDLLGVKCEGIPDPEDITEKDSALIVWGGADINPALYGHAASKRTYFGGGTRDEREWAMMKKAVSMGVPIIGVCRGAQMACALAGGHLIQDVSGHSGYHNVTTPDGRELSVNSIHHQMMVATDKVDHELLAWSTQARSKEYIYQDDKLFEIPTGWVEPEFYYFPKIKAFAVQWHPEMMDDNEPATKYVMEKIHERIGVSA